MSRPLALPRVIFYLLRTVQLHKRSYPRLTSMNQVTVVEASRGYLQDWRMADIARNIPHKGENTFCFFPLFHSCAARILNKYEVVLALSFRQRPRHHVKALNTLGKMDLEALIGIHAVCGLSAIHIQAGT